MENNNTNNVDNNMGNVTEPNNMETIKPANKSGKGIVWFIVIIIIIAIVALIFLKTNKMTPEEAQSEMEINKAIEEDNTTSISDNLDDIDLSNPANEDLMEVDAEIENL